LLLVRPCNVSWSPSGVLESCILNLLSEGSEFGGNHLGSAMRYGTHAFSSAIRTTAARIGTVRAWHSPGDEHLRVRSRAASADLRWHREQREPSSRNVEQRRAVTPGYDMLNLTLSIGPADSGYTVYLRGTNLLDEVVWNHASYLARVVPLPGRGVTAD
jgi:outer membrane receptor protein involved in Fe transport